LGGVDREIARASKFLEPAGVVFRQGQNEELAATAVAGTQLLGQLEHRRLDGVAGIWFGKNPGLDRAADAIRHANVSGTAPQGGAVAWIGDDPASKSSTVPSSSEPMCRSLMLPLLAPGSIDEVLRFGIHAVEMSRYAGLWTGLKIVADVADSTAVVSVDGLFDSIPELVGDRVFQPPVLLPPTNLAAELDLMSHRLARAAEYAEAANLNRVTFEPETAELAIVAAGMSYQSLQRAIGDLGLTEDDLDNAGIRLVQLGMPWPLEPRTVRRLVGGVSTVLVIEDKLPFVEGLIKEALFGAASVPSVVGKYDRSGAPLLSMRGSLVSDDVAVALRQVLPGLPVQNRPTPRRRRIELLPSRAPAFCSGCPHSVSTRADSDQLVGVGIGCHIMVALEPRGKRGELVGMTQMGGEGAQWLGLEPFTDDPHFFQNVGDGTFYHSASLALRALIAAGSTITYKLLFNDAVAMTGGQAPLGQMGIPALTKWLTLEGVRRIVITTAHPEAWQRTKFGKSVSVRHRDELPVIQRELAKERGVTVLLHIDRCATEERRLRKLGKVATPAERIWINERVCEGCGDCGDKSTCLSVLPVESEFGRKTQIHQSSCNQDTSCLHGDCPSFVKVVPSAKPVVERVPIDTSVPDPSRRVAADVLVRMTGIGGTGVLTVSAVLQMAAYLQGSYTAGLEQIGLAQKGGPVISDIRFSTTAVSGQIRAGTATVDVLLGFDSLGAAAESVLDSLRGTATAVVNIGRVPTAEMVQDTQAPTPAWHDLRSRIDNSTDGSRNVYLDVQVLARRFFADHMPVNMILVGAAFQAGVLPVDAWAIEDAIRLNGTNVDTNVEAFRLGRIAVAAPEHLENPAPGPTPISAEVQAIVARSVVDAELITRVERLTEELVAYQDVAYASRFVDDVTDIATRTAATGVANSAQIARAFCEGLFKLMAYKDEYEVARLHLDSVERTKLVAEFGTGAKVKVMLHPPLLRALGWKNKIAFGAWALPILRLIYAMRRLRGSRVDIFGRSHIRRVERALPSEYHQLMHEAVARLSPVTLPLILELAQSPDMIRGYEHIKIRSVDRFRSHVTGLLNRLDTEPTDGH
jgi:indolepyruvate ferredoxin oxidoreductase